MWKACNKQPKRNLSRYDIITDSFNWGNFAFGWYALCDVDYWGRWGRSDGSWTVGRWFSFAVCGNHFPRQRWEILFQRRSNRSQTRLMKFTRPHQRNWPFVLAWFEVGLMPSTATLYSCLLGVNPTNFSPFVWKLIPFIYLTCDNYTDRMR